MTTFKVEDMHCNKCVARISKAFDTQNLVYKISLENKTVSVEGFKAGFSGDYKQTALSVMDDLGFSPVEI